MIKSHVHKPSNENKLHYFDAVPSNRLLNQIKHHPRKPLSHFRLRQILYHLIPMRLAAIQNRVIEGFGEIAQHRLLRRIILNLIHDTLVFADFVSDRLGVIGKITVAQPIGDEEFVEARQDL